MKRERERERERVIESVCVKELLLCKIDEINHGLRQYTALKEDG